MDRTSQKIRLNHDEVISQSREGALVDNEQLSEKDIPVEFEHSSSLPELLGRLEVSLVVSTYQAGKIFTVGSLKNQLTLRFHHFEEAMGITRTNSGLAVGTKRQVWMLPAAPRGLAHSVQPAGTHDACFLARHAHFTGPTMGHDLAFCNGKLWMVNTLFNCLSTIEADHSFTPQWKPPFISEIARGDRCHLNGLAADDHEPQFVTVLAETDTIGGWRENKATSGCLLHVPTGSVVLRGLSMPHSPRIYDKRLWFLHSGYGRLELFDAAHGQAAIIATLPGYARGLDFYKGHAFVGLSKIRETNAFGGLPISEYHDRLECGVVIIDCSNGKIVGSLFFQSHVDEIYEVQALPGYRNPIISGPYPDIDKTETIWLVPQQDMP